MFSIFKNDDDLQIINGMLQGLTTEQISVEFNYSYSTVKDRKSKIFKKLKVKSSFEMTIKITKLNILKEIKFLNSQGLDGDQILVNLVTSIKNELKDQEKEFDRKKAVKDDRFQIIASEYSKKACKNNGGGKILRFKESLKMKYHRLRAKLAAYIATNKALKRKIIMLEEKERRKNNLESIY